MTKTRLEAFSDGVFAIIITIMVLELKIPHSGEWKDLFAIWPTFSSYIISFVYVGIYWGNHHHLLHTLHKVNSKIIWANLHLLFWLSLMPFATGWMGENHFATNPVVLYGAELFLCGFAFYFLQQEIIKTHTGTSALTEALAKQTYKGYLSLAGYTVAIISAFYLPAISQVFFIAVALMWIIPDKNIEKALRD